MKKLIICIAFSAMLGPACKNKKEEKKDFFPVISFIKSQVSHVDTSLYSIIKIVKIDSTADTSWLRREEFRREAKEFLELPDLTEKKYREDYTESRLYDESINRVIITYLPVKDDAEIQRQEVVITPGFGGEDKMRSIIFDRQISNGNNTEMKRMLWLVDESFQVVRIIQKNNQPDSIITTEVIWNRKD